ncbi:hypothetical protein ASG22_03455 [Chryseobacterium sp. Leaf405]|uniref:hypothetical protein n=1 Tax=Chryseobacterium sp. Leaf405 TaxID=1736367 RepID=UPI0006F71676|nr:hypothetical protein [Chryseobacterium sp. Leaf405]KQT25778.1 hypothetical protein ASG22_03455 [Chryseobacterium sp. Leaf405]
MGLTNLNSTHLSTAKITAAQDAIAALETALAEITINLSAEDRKRYGSINEQNKLFVNKVSDYNSSQPNLSSPEVDWDEFNKDHSSRNNMETMISRLESIITRLNNAKTLHDYDNYQSALVDYSYTTYKAGTASPGFEDKYKDLKQFFLKNATTTAPPEAKK